MNGDFTLAVHALAFLNHKKETVSSDMLADNICTHPARVRKVMALLKKAKLVETKEGRPSGGYMFTLDAEVITLNDVAKAVSAMFVSSDWRSGSMDKECLVASGMGEIMDGIYTELNTLCYNRLTKTTIADIDRQIFGGVQSK